MRQVGEWAAQQWSPATETAVQTHVSDAETCPTVSPIGPL